MPTEYFHRLVESMNCPVVAVMKAEENKLLTNDVSPIMRRFSVLCLSNVKE